MIVFYSLLILLQVCCKDLWFLETEKPASPGRVQLVRASTNALEVSWGGVPNAEGYILQVQKYEVQPAAQTAAAAAISGPVTAEPSPPLAPKPIASPQIPVSPRMGMMTRPAAPMPVRGNSLNNFNYINKK